MINLKIKQWVKNNIAPHDVKPAYRKMVKKYNALSVADKVEFEQDLSESITKGSK